MDGLDEIPAADRRRTLDWLRPLRKLTTVSVSQRLTGTDAKSRNHPAWPVST